MKSHTCDVLVVGSGASGMTCAITAASLGLDVLIVEKEPKFGGTTARSGGWLWIPGSHLAREQGIEEEPGAARRYLEDQATTHFDAERVDAFLANGPRAVEFLTRNTCVAFDLHPQFPDYHAEAPGGSLGGRSMVTRPFDARALGPQVRQLAPPIPELTVFGMMLGSGKDLWHFVRAFRSPESFLHVARRLSRHALDVRTHGRGMTLANGNALAGRLARAVFDLGVPLWLSSPVITLQREGERVTGAVVHRPDGPRSVRARCGVVLACGGFPHDAFRRQQLFPHCSTAQSHVTPSPPANTGDGLRLAEAAGGIVDPTIPNAAAWVPTSKVPRPDGTEGVMPHFVDRAKPGVIAVDSTGRRFTNEANSYHDFVQAMFEACAGRPEVMAWLLCDHHTLRTYGLGCVPPFPMPIGRHVRSGYLRKAASIEELAGMLDVDPGVLQETVSRSNEDARLGRDSAFGKGSTAYNRFQGDAQHGPNPCLGPIAKAPFYAIRLAVGDIGTFAGLSTDAAGRVLSADREPVAGLFAVGNDAASIMGGNYPGGGITLGPAVTFGYICAHVLAGREDALGQVESVGGPAACDDPAGK
jgi:succinate dehydrogenase/fumarate reductase flavoprotein subunit